MALGDLLGEYNLWFWVTRAIFLTGLLLVGVSIYNVLFHPLASFPGPLLWRVSRLPYTRGSLGGRFPYQVRTLHEQYGDVVRTAPNELSFASPSAWDDIYSNTAGANSQAFPKSALWHGQTQPGPPSVFAAIDFKEHSRIRRFMDPAFSEKATLKQEPILQEYTDLWLEKLRGQRTPKGTITVNIVDWLNFVLYDIIGDLSLGESFGCLAKCEHESWMSKVVDSITLQYIHINLRHYPMLTTALAPFMGILIPKSFKQALEDFRQLSIDRLNRRLASQPATDRQDIVSYLLQSEDRKEGLTKDEVMMNSMLFIHAASETTGTTLTGVLNHLLRNPTSLSALEREIRQFAHSSDLTLDALRKLPYLNGVLKEALRMCNPNPIGHMRITPPSGGIVAGRFVPGNTFVTVHPITISYSEENFHEPHSWRPERWLDQAKTDPKSPYYHDNRKAVRGFGCGPYGCVGEPLAWAQMRLIIAKLVWSFDLTRSDTPNARIIWHKVKVYGFLEKHPLDVILAERNV